MFEVLSLPAFDAWLDGLPNEVTKARIIRRIDRLAAGNPGDAAPVGSGVSELRMHFGPGYRVYFVRRGTALVMLLGGGTKRSQAADIAVAIAQAAAL